MGRNINRMPQMPKSLPFDFWSDRSGNFLQIFALAAVPLMMAGGMALDYTRMSESRTELQNSLDAALLSIGQDFRGMSKSEAEGKFKEFLQGNLDPALHAAIETIKFEFDPDDFRVAATIESGQETSLMQLAGYKRIGYSAAAEIRTASSKLEVALVLDNTYSMTADNKLEDLKSAAGDFVSTMMALNEFEDKVAIGIVPFSNHVNVGMSMAGSEWLRVPADEEVCYMTRPVVSTSNCTPVTRYRDGVPYKSQQCEYTYGPEEQRCYTATWNGCVGSRLYPLNLRDADYSERVPGIPGNNCPDPITDLSSSESTLLANINDMVANGDTYIPAGLTWGMRILSKREPFSNAASDEEVESENIDRVLILMTDGENQRSAELPSEPTHWGSNIAQADTWTTEVCDQIKAQGISIYTVTFGDSIPTDTRDLIMNCASAPSQYFHAASGEELSEAFKSVSKKLTKLSLSR